MSKLSVAEQGHGFEIQKDVRYYLGFTPTQSHLHDPFDIDSLYTHVKAINVKSSKFPQGTINLSDAKTYLSCNDPHTIIAVYHERLDDQDVIVNRLAWFLIKSETIKIMWGDLTLDDAIKFNECIESMGCDKYTNRDTARRWKKEHSHKSSLMLNPKMGPGNDRLQISITTRRLVNILSKNEYATLSLEEYRNDPNVVDNFPGKFRQLLPILGRRYSHKQRFSD